MKLSIYREQRITLNDTIGMQLAKSRLSKSKDKQHAFFNSQPALKNERERERGLEGKDRESIERHIY